jgi:hypothetical protein
MPLIGFLHGASPDAYLSQMRAFREVLNESGFVEGKNLAIEYRWAEEHIDRGQPVAMAQLDPMYGPAVRSKKISTSWGVSGLASMYPASEWSIVLRAIMDISAPAISLADRPQRAIWVTSIRKRREDRSSISSHPLADLRG